MGFAVEAVRAFFDANKPTVGLRLAGKEITTAGYVRAYPTWTVGDASASAFVSWQMSTFARFDEITVFVGDGDEVLEPLPFGGTQSLAPWLHFESNLDLSIDPIVKAIQ